MGEWVFPLVRSAQSGGISDGRAVSEIAGWWQSKTYVLQVDVMQRASGLRRMQETGAILRVSRQYSSSPDERISNRSEAASVPDNAAKTGSWSSSGEPEFIGNTLSMCFRGSPW